MLGWKKKLQDSKKKKPVAPAAVVAAVVAVAAARPATKLWVASRSLSVSNLVPDLCRSSILLNYLNRLNSRPLA